MTSPDHQRYLDVQVTLPGPQLDGWMNTISDLAAWLTCPDRAVIADHTRRHPDGPTLTHQAWALVDISQTIYTLLTGLPPEN